MEPGRRLTRASAQKQSARSSSLPDAPRGPENVPGSASNTDVPSRPEGRAEDESAEEEQASTAQQEQTQGTNVQEPASVQPAQPIQATQESREVVVRAPQPLVGFAKNQPFQAPIMVGDQALQTLQAISDYVDALPTESRYDAQCAIGEKLHELYVITNEVTRQFYEDVKTKGYYRAAQKTEKAFEADFEELREPVKSARTALERTETSLRRLEKLVAESARLTEALKYVKAELPTAGHSTWSRFVSLITMEKNPRNTIRRINDEVYRRLVAPVKYAHNDIVSLRAKDFTSANGKVSFAFEPLEIDANILRTNSLGYHASGLLVLGTENMVFPEFPDESNVEATEETRPPLSSKKVFEVDEEGNEIQERHMSRGPRKRIRLDNTSFPESQAIKRQALESKRHLEAEERRKQEDAQRKKLAADRTLSAMQHDLGEAFSQARLQRPGPIGGGAGSASAGWQEDPGLDFDFGGGFGEVVGPPVYGSTPRKARGGGRGVGLTPLKEKVETPVPALPDTEGDYDVKEITRDELNERTSVRTLFLKQSCICIMPKTWLAAFEDPEFEMTSFDKHRESLLQPLGKIEANNNIPCLEHCRAIFKRFKLKPLFSSNVRAYIYILLRILQVTSTQGGETARLSVAARNPLTAKYFAPTEKVRKIQKESLGLLKFKPTGDVSWKEGIKKSGNPEYYLHQEVLDLSTFIAHGCVHSKRLFRFLHEDSELRNLLAEEICIYRWHYRKSATPGDVTGLIRIMWNTIGQQLIRQHPLNYFMHLRLRTDQATALYAFPTLLRCLEKGEAVLDFRYQGDSQLLREDRGHGVMDLIPFYPTGTCPKLRPESVVKEPEGPEVLAGGLNIVRKWLRESKASRSDISLNDEYDSEGISLIGAIEEALAKTDEEEHVCHWDPQRRAPGEALYLKSGIPVSFSYTPEYDQAWFSSGLVAEDPDRPGFLENGVSISVWRQHMLDMTPPPQFRFSDGVDYCPASLLPQVRLEGLGPISQALVGFSLWSEQDVVEEVEKFKEGNRMAGTIYSNWEKRAIVQAKAALKKFKKREEAMFGDRSYQRHREKESELPEDEDSLSDTDDLVLPFTMSQPTGISESEEEENQEESEEGGNQEESEEEENQEESEETQQIPKPGVPQAGYGSSPRSPSIEALTPEAERIRGMDPETETSKPIPKPSLCKAND
jgi:hypothetical protein